MGELQGRTARRVLWLVLSLPIVALSLGWWALGLFGFVFACDEACGVDSADPSSWQWTGQFQFVLAIVGVVAAAGAVGLGLADRWRRSLVAGVVALVCAAVWWEWTAAMGL